MKTLSIDIGIRNLSMCIMSCTVPGQLDTYNVELWETFDTLENDEHFCEALQKNEKVCGKKCSFKYGDTFTCKKHFPKDIPITKNNRYKKKLIKNYLLQDIAIVVLKKIQLIYDDNEPLFKTLTSIIIELQPTVNPRMKFISHVIYAKLTDLFISSTVSLRFVSASIKLRAYDGPRITCHLKNGYSKRKWLSVQYTKWILENKFSEDQGKWSSILENGKVDDNSDTFLMCINTLNKIKLRG